MQQLDLKTFLNGDEEDDTNPVLNDRFEIKELIKTTGTSKIYIGFDIVTDADVIIKFRTGKARDQFVDNYNYLDEDMVPGLLWEETIRSNHVLIYEKKGSDIDTLFKKASNHFSPITVGMIFHLSICALEKIHSKKIIHGNLKPSKILTNDNEDGHKLFITGFEFCERKSSRSANKIPKNADPKAKKLNENIYSSINNHKGEALGYRDDLESLGYIIFNLFSNGKFLENYAHFSETNRPSLIKLKSGLRTNPMMSTIPAEFGEYLKYINKLKPDDAPNYDQLKILTFKLCQKIYVKQEIISIFDWVNIPEEDKSNYRARMLSYFFCNEASNSKKLKLQKFSYDSIFPKRKQGTTVVTNPLPQALPTTTDTQITKTFQNMPILETQEEQNATKYYLDGFQLELDEEYAAFPSTPRLTTKEKAYINFSSKMGKLRSPTIEEEEKTKVDNNEQAEDKKEVDLPKDIQVDQANQQSDDKNEIADTIEDDQITEDVSIPVMTNHNIENYSLKVRGSLHNKIQLPQNSSQSQNIGSIDIPPLKEVKANVSQSIASTDSKRSYRESYSTLSKPKLKLEQVRPADK